MRGTHEQHRVDVSALQDRPEERGCRVLGQRCIFAVLHYADDLVLPAACGWKVFANHIDCSEEPPGKGLVHDRDERGVGIVVFVEDTPREQPRAGDRKIVRGDVKKLSIELGAGDAEICRAGSED